MRGTTGEHERWRAAAVAGAWLFSMVAACEGHNPDFDEPTTSSDTGTASPSSDESTSMGSVVTGDGTSSSGPPGTSSGEPGTSSGEPPSTTSGGPPSTTSGGPGTTSGGPGTTSGGPGGGNMGCMGTSCDGECVDVMTDPDNCGMCDEKCHGQRVCVGGECMHS